MTVPLSEQISDYINAPSLVFGSNPMNQMRRNENFSTRPSKNVGSSQSGTWPPGFAFLAMLTDRSLTLAQEIPWLLFGLLPTLADPNGTSLLLLHNFNRFLNNPEVIQTTFAQLIAGKQQRTFLVVLSTVVQIPVELEKLFVVLEHPLPDRQALERIARELTSDSPEDLPQGDDLQRVLDAAAGLTRYEAEGAFALSLTRHNSFQPQTIWDIKSGTLRKNGLLTLHRGNETLDIWVVCKP